ncbi:MAG: hypothetical protein JSU87_05020 [Gemmatimonadota bacterium]|nr:MAG: hypothetical protein JSU87_05020 [Gemmatimonadota bacterium]
MFKRQTLVSFTVGFILGIVAALVAQPLLGDRLPEAVTGKRQLVAGVVSAKQREGDRLLLTVNTPLGATLVTFQKRVAEISLLVERGDSLTLALGAYQPFLEDPQITRVAKTEGTGAPTAADSTGVEGGMLPGESPDSAAADSLGQPGDTAAEPAAKWYD